jgi:NAD+ diphosphatase
MDYAFAAAGLDRSAELRERHLELERMATTATARWLLVRDDGAAAVSDHGELRLIPGDALAYLPETWAFLGRLAGQPVFAACWQADLAPDAGRWLDLRAAAGVLDAGQAGLLAYARALCDWRRRHRHCGRCGGRRDVRSGGHRLDCPDCAEVVFPRTDPAIIVTVRHGDRCLLGRQPGWPARRYSTLAGFVEPGETLEAAVAREVSEEAGVRIDHCRYLGSQPWPFPTSLMLGFDAVASDARIVLGPELEDARWFDPDQFAQALATGAVLPPAAVSISPWLIERWYRELTGTPLPRFDRN